jgi:hypothetical protein
VLLLLVLVCDQPRLGRCVQVLFNTQLDYDPPMVRTPCRVSFSFRIDGTLSSPDRIVLHLPGFQLQGASGVTRVLLEGSAAQYLDKYGTYAGACLANPVGLSPLIFHHPPCNAAHLESGPA